MELRTVCVDIIVCKCDESWYKDYEFIKTYYPEDPNLAVDGLTNFQNKLGSTDDIEYIGVMNVRVAEPEEHMTDSCDTHDEKCHQCPHFEMCFE